MSLAARCRLSSPTPLNRSTFTTAAIPTSISRCSHPPLLQPPPAPAKTTSQWCRHMTQIQHSFNQQPDSQISSGAPLVDTRLSQAMRDLIPLMRAQAPHYLTLHIHGFPYLVTAGDTIRLPFLMHGVAPGDVLRLNRAINLGSRDFTLKPPAPLRPIRSTATSPNTTADVDTEGLASVAVSNGASPAPHFIPHIAKGKHSYLDERLFVCRAVVVGVESEPMRIKEKTKRRQRHVRSVKSKHRYTVLKIKEISVRSVEEIEEGHE